MVFLRVMLLGFWTAYAWGMGHQGGPLNGFGEMVSLSVFLAAPALYLLPAYEAWKRDHENLTAIVAINLLLGWTLLGWVAALVWALKQPTTVIAAAPAVQDPPGATRRLVNCPMCAEQILAAAKKCKHCGSLVPQS